MVGWRMASQLPLASDTQFRVRIGMNEFRGSRKVQLTVEEMRG
jgi:hypothetical protein